MPCTTACPLTPTRTPGMMTPRHGRLGDTGFNKTAGPGPTVLPRVPFVSVLREGWDWSVWPLLQLEGSAWHCLLGAVGVGGTVSAVPSVDMGWGA